MGMKRRKFIENFNRAPICLEDLADAAAQVTDCEQLSTAGQDFLDAKAHFELVLEEAGVEIG